MECIEVSCGCWAAKVLLIVAMFLWRVFTHGDSGFFRLKFFAFIDQAW